MHKMQVCILTGKSLWVNLPFFKRTSFSYFAYFCRFPYHADEPPRLFPRHKFDACNLTSIDGKTSNAPLTATTRLTSTSRVQVQNSLYVLFTGNVSVAMHHHTHIFGNSANIFGAMRHEKAHPTNTGSRREGDIHPPQTGIAIAQHRNRWSDGIKLHKNSRTLNVTRTQNHVTRLQGIVGLLAQMAMNIRNHANKHIQLLRFDENESTRPGRDEKKTGARNNSTMMQLPAHKTASQAGSQLPRHEWDCSCHWQDRSCQPSGQSPKRGTARQTQDKTGERGSALYRASGFRQSFGRTPVTTSIAACMARVRSSMPDSSDQYATCGLSTV